MAETAVIIDPEREQKRLRGLARRARVRRQLSLHAMLVPGVVLAVVFSIVPMIGIIMAFEDYNVVQGFFGSKFVDVWNFRVLFTRPDFWQATYNTFLIAVVKLVCTSILSVVFALLINEVQHVLLKKTIQTVIFLPYFLSWALLGSIVVEMFSLNGSFNTLVAALGLPTKSWITDPGSFRTLVVVTDVWKTLGYQVVVFLAAITNIDPSLYEAAKIDGANYAQLCRHITIPGMMTMIVLMCILNIGNVMNAGFEQILVMYSPSVYDKGDILDTMAYRIGLVGNSFSVGTAIGLFKSVISCIFFAFSYWLAYKVKGYRIF